MDTNYYITTGNTPVAIWFSQIPPPATIGCKQIYPFTISLCAFDNSPHVINLYSQGSKSEPYQTPQNKWSHLVPQWKFIDDTGLVVDTITTIDTVISTTEFQGVTGYANFYYVDDLPTLACNPLILWATLETSGLSLSSESDNSKYFYPSYSNTKVVTYLPYIVNGGSPTHLKITRNGIDPLSTGTYWLSSNIPAIITIHGSPVASSCSTSVSSYNILYDYPTTNARGVLSGPISKKIVGLGDTDQFWKCFDTTVNTTTSYFQALDANQNRICGYNRNTVVPYVTTLNSIITAGVSAIYDAPYYDTTFIWVSDPNNNKLYKIFSPYCVSANSFIQDVTAWVGTYRTKINETFNTPYITEKTILTDLTGFGGIYSIAVDPCYNIWATDSEMDKIYKFSSSLGLISTIDLHNNVSLLNYGVTAGCTPAGVSLDNLGNFWVCLYDSLSVLKFDKNGTISTIIGNSDLGTLSTENIFKPVLAETDKYNNVWVTYNYPLSSSLNKYDSNGSLLYNISLPNFSCPMDLLVDSSNNVFVTLTNLYGPPHLTGQIRKYDETGTLLLSTTVNNPAYIAMDLNSNIWITKGFNELAKYDTNLSLLTTLTIGDTAVPSGYDSQTVLEYNALEGVACDSTNRIWVINSFENSLYSIKNDIIYNKTDFTSNKTLWYFDTAFNIQSLSATWTKSLQAFGDWTGLKYVRKYLNTSNSLSTVNVYLTGASDTFAIESFDGYDFRKYNESWNISTQMREYALAEHYNEYYNLFINYLGTMVGGLETDKESVGRKSYEKTANFVANHSDVDTCNVDSIYSLSKEFDVPIDNYKIGFPTDVQRLMDTFSISQRKLWGNRCKCKHHYFDKNAVCKNCGHVHTYLDTNENEIYFNNKGNQIDVTTYQVSANIPFLVKYDYSPYDYTLISPVISASSVYNIVTSYFTSARLYTDFSYFEYNESFCNQQIEGIINWGDVYTTLNENVSSLSAWYNKGGLIEKMFNYFIRKGCNI